LAGVFDDGLRAEFTVLGAPMNALPRIERRAKEKNVDVVASFLDRLPPTIRSEIAIDLLPTGEDAEPEIAVVYLRGAEPPGFTHPSPASPSVQA
jgi:hypothetical protein